MGSAVVWLVIGVVFALLAAGLAAVIAIGFLMQKRQALGRTDAVQRFTQRREELETLFFEQAAASGRPRGLAWVDCDFGADQIYARDRNSGQLRALVPVTIRFEAVAGGGMEDNPNVANLRAATAVFHYDGREWSTTGQVIFNLEPAEALQHFQHELEPWDVAGP
ncbi:hypothetical protein [Lignipirellula cremea]|uniref:Uncharacterized protein n=1 Tax=Lignipirellula cremea TaxID=2528010 RepID=A0A518DXS0_9BACT|nr:hypothetical protein [Lignipirellula cremea]QDU96646.1 hypothetical protein Pla8534_44670 [Lignipirellula cremea]